MSDITQHKFSDSILGVRCVNTNDNQIAIKTNGAEFVFFDRNDIIVMARHEKLTEKELTQ